MFFLTFVSADKKRLLPSSWSHHVSGCSRIDAKLSALRELERGREHWHLATENWQKSGELALSQENRHALYFSSIYLGGKNCGMVCGRVSPTTRQNCLQD